MGQYRVAREGEKDKRMKQVEDRRGAQGFTLVELIAVVAILAILLALAAPQMSGYIKAAHDSAAQTEAKLAADAVQRYLYDELEKGTLNYKTLHKLMSTELNNPDSLLKDYIRGGQKGARIAYVNADVNTGRLISITYDSENCKSPIKVSAGEDGNYILEYVGND